MMEGFGVHTSMWTMSWDQKGCEHAVAKACCKHIGDPLKGQVGNPPAPQGHQAVRRSCEFLSLSSLMSPVSCLLSAVCCLLSAVCCLLSVGVGPGNEQVTLQ